jgi:hypothetical protein
LSHFPFFRSAIIIAIRRNRVQALAQALKEDKPGQEGTSFLTALAPGQTLVASPVLYSVKLCVRSNFLEALLGT